jgi:hypothetical protein
LGGDVDVDDGAFGVFAEDGLASVEGGAFVFAVDDLADAVDGFCGVALALLLKRGGELGFEGGVAKRLWTYRRLTPRSSAIWCAPSGFPTGISGWSGSGSSMPYTMMASTT